MRGDVSRITLVLALVSALCWIAPGCGGETSDPDGGTGGSGGAGGAGGADSGSDAGTVGCLQKEMLPVACPTPPVTYSKVQPILQARCVSVCHNGKTPDPEHPGETIWGLTEHSHLKDWQDGLRDTIANCTMPPADAGLPVTIEERIAILEFIRCGLPQ